MSDEQLENAPEEQTEFYESLETETEDAVDEPETQSEPIDATEEPEAPAVEEPAPVEELTGQEPIPVEEEEVPETEASEAPPPAQPRSAAEILQEKGLLPQGYQAPQGAYQPQAPPQQQYVQHQQQYVPQPQQQQPLSQEQIINQQIEMLAQNHYGLDKETVEELEATGNEKLVQLVPQLVSRAFVDAIMVSEQHMAQRLPVMMEQFNAQQQVNQQSADAFYEFWEGQGYDLRQYDNDLTSMAMAYVSQNPQTDLPNAIQNIGAQLIIAKQLSPAGEQAAQAMPQQRQPAFNSAGGPQAGGQAMPDPNTMEGFLTDVVENADFYD